MTSRRAFLAGLAAMAAPLFARLALPAAPERKLLPLPRIPHAGVHAEQIGWHLYVRHFDILGREHWAHLGEVSKVTLEFEPIRAWGETFVVVENQPLVPTHSVFIEW